MEQGKPDYWFPVKRYGWGWGPPVRWQGWAVLVLYFASLVLGIRYLDTRHSPAQFLVLLVIATLILIAVVAWKGERPVKFRWDE
jgi:hypothetical protein